MIPVPFPMPMGTPDPARAELDEARLNLSLLRDKVAELQRRVEKQAVLLRALFELLGEGQGVTEAGLLARFRHVELEKATAEAKLCSQCGRAINQRHNRCLYCGEVCQVKTAFDLLELSVWPELSPKPTGIAAKPPADRSITKRPRGRNL
jgi:hypothetical protein